MKKGEGSAINTHSFSKAVTIALVILVLSLAYPNTSAQTTTSFTPASEFRTPAYNGSISFAENGTYSTATLQNDTWTFTDLNINMSQPLETLWFSVKNSDVTIFAYQTNAFGFQGDQLIYSVQGEGQQVVNMGVGAHGSSADWVVFTNGTLPNHGWSVSTDGTVTVTGLTGIIDIVYFGFTNELGSNLPFYEQHSVAIGVAALFVATVAVAVCINVVGRRRPAASQLKESKL